MSARKRKFNSLKPLDTLNSPRTSSPRSSVSLAPKRYNTFRKDQKIVDHLNNASTKDFLPVLSTDNEKRNEVELSDDEGAHTEASDQEFEPLQSSPLKKHSGLKRTSNGLLFRMSNDLSESSVVAVAATTTPFSNDSIVSTKLNLNGQFSCIDSKTSQIYQHKSPCIMTFVSDHNHPRFSLYFQQLLIKNSQINLLDDTESIILDRRNSLMAVLLKDSKNFSMILDINNSSINIKSRILIWSNTSSASNKRIKSIKRFLLASYSSSISVQILDNKEQVLERLKHLAHSTLSSPPRPPPSSNMERAINSTKNAFDSLRLKKTKFSNSDDDNNLQTHARFLSNKPHGLQSLTKRARITSLAKRDYSISIPKSNISSLDFYNNGTTETLQSHTASQLRRSSRFKDILHSNSNSDSNTNTDFDDATSEFETPEPFKPSLRYKFNDGSSYTITSQDFKCLFNKDWVNDSILDFFTKFYIESSIEKSIIKRDQVHLMSSFFYTKLISNPTDYYSNVKKWVNNTDLFSKKYVVVPINISYHWFSCIITNLDAILDFHRNKDKNEAINSDEISINNPLINILTFDSLRQTHSREIDPIKEFLISYASDKYSIQLDKTQIKMKTCSVPQQPNMSDCGVHVILNIKKFFENPMETIDIWKNSKIKNKQFTTKTINKYFDKSERNNARKDLRHTLKLLQFNYIGHLKKENLYDEIMKKEEKQSANTNSDEDDADDEEIQIIENVDQQPTKKDTAHLTSEPPCPPSPSTDNPSTPTKKKSRTKTELANAVVENQSESQSADEIISNGEDPIHTTGGETPSVSPPIRHNILQSSSPSIPESANEAEQEEFTSPYFGRPSLKTRARQFEGVSSPIRNDQIQSSIHDSAMVSPKPKRIYPSKKIPPPSSYIQTLSTDSMEPQSSSNDNNIIISDTEQDLQTGENSESNDTGGITNNDDSDVSLIGGLPANIAEKIDDRNQEGSDNNDSLGKILQNVDKELNEKLIDIDDVAFTSPTRRLSRTSKRRKESSPQFLSDYENDNNDKAVMEHVSGRDDNENNIQSHDNVWDEGRNTPILLEDDEL